ncbi:MAG: hypothetical protein ACLUOI_33910 [Eisenbergiella sp.]
MRLAGTGIKYVEPAFLRRTISTTSKDLKLFDDDFLEYLRGFTSGDIYAIPEGTIVFPRGH